MRPTTMLQQFTFSNFLTTWTVLVCQKWMHRHKKTNVARLLRARRISLLALSTAWKKRRRCCACVEQVITTAVCDSSQWRLGREQKLLSDVSQATNALWFIYNDTVPTYRWRRSTVPPPRPATTAGVQRQGSHVWHAKRRVFIRSLWLQLGNINYVFEFLASLT